MRYPTLDIAQHDERRVQARLDEWANQTTPEEISEMLRYLLDNPSEF